MLRLLDRTRSPAGLRSASRGETPPLDAAQAHRLIRLTLAELRALSLSLQGSGEARGGEVQSAIEPIRRRLLGLAADLAAATEQPAAPRTLDEEWLPLGDALEAAVSQVEAELAPSVRRWRLDPELARYELRSDRRALHQVFLRVLSTAASTTREGDWIEADLRGRPDGIEIAVTDEGYGRPGAEVFHADDTVEHRALGLGMSLVLSLMAAHGGSLSIESVACVGSRVTLFFPARRVQALTPASQTRPN